MFVFMSEYGLDYKECYIFCSIFNVSMISFMFILIPTFPHELKPLIKYLTKRINWNCSSSPTLTTFSALVWGLHRLSLYYPKGW